MSGYKKSHGRPGDRLNDRRETLGLSRDEANKSSDSSSLARDRRWDKDSRGRNIQSGQNRSREQSLGSSSNDHRRAQAPDFSTVMKFFVEMTTLVTDSAVERLYERNLEKAQEKTNAEYRKADEKHSDWPDVVQFQKHKNEDLLRQTTAAKKRREHAESLVRNKAESFCKDLIENLLLVDIQNRAQDNTLKDSDASSKDLNAILKDVGATRQGLDDLRKGLVDLRFTFASLKNTVQQNLDNAKQRGNMMQKEIVLLQNHMGGIEELRYDELAAKIDKLSSSFERNFKDQRQSYENELAQASRGRDQLEKMPGGNTAKEVGDLRTASQALLQRVTAQEKKILELSEDQQRVAKQVEKIKDLEAQQKALSQGTLPEHPAIRGELDALQQKSRETTISTELAAVRVDLAELQRKAEEKDEVLNTLVTTLGNPVAVSQPVVTTETTDIDNFRQRLGVVEAKVGNTDISGLDLSTLDHLAEWYTMQWPMKETEIAALVTKINKLGAGTTLPQGLPVDGAERFIQLAADLRAELNAKVEQLNKGLQATMDLCKGLVKDLGEQVKDLARRTDANTAASEACRTEMHSWQARIEKVQEVEEELRDSMDVCRLSVASLESQFSNLSTKELAVLILRQLEQLHPNSVRLDADNQWLRDKIDSLENDFQGVKRKLEEGSYVPNPNTGNHDIASCLDYARDMARSIKRRRLSDA